MLKRWFGMSGRLGRGGYNARSVVAVLLLILAQVVLIAPLLIPPLPDPPITLASIPLGWNAVLAAILGGAGLWIAVSCSVRRLHDLGWSGLWLTLCLAPLVELALAAGVGLLVLLSVLRGTRGPNDYGDRAPPGVGA